MPRKTEIIEKEINGEIVLHKKCTKCNEIKPLADYNNSGRSSYGKKPECRECRHKYNVLEITRNRNTEKWRNNKEENNRKMKERYHSKLKNDKTYKQRQKWRKLIRDMLLYDINKKDCKVIREIGYTPLELRQHIESLWTVGMSWQNYGEWTIDHIKPITLFDNSTPSNIVNALSNLQPLWKKNKKINGVEYLGNQEKGYSSIGEKQMYLKKISFGDYVLSDLTRRFIDKYLSQNWLTIGVVTQKLEKKWCKIFEYKYAKLMNSGTSALIASLISLYDFGANQNDEVITSSLSFIATANAIRASGFKPIFIDIDIETLNIQTEKIEEKITNKTKAICVPNIMGRPCELDKLQEICKKYNLKFICDNCESYGSKFKGKHSLEYADIEISSHFAAHIIMMGEAGIASTNDENISNILTSIRSHGREPNNQYFNHIRFGLNLKPMDFQASLGLGELSKYKRIFNTRKKNLQYLLDGLEKFKDLAFFNKNDDEIFYHAPHALTITLKEQIKDKLLILKQGLDLNKIEWKRNFGSIPTQQKCFEYLGYKLGDFPNAEYVGDFGIHLPVHQYLTKDDLERILLVLNNFFNKFLKEKNIDIIMNNFEKSNSLSYQI